LFLLTEMRGMICRRKTDEFEIFKQQIANESTNINPGRRAETAIGSWKFRHGLIWKPIREYWYSGPWWEPCRDDQSQQSKLCKYMRMRGLSILKSEAYDFEGVSMMNSETFAKKDFLWSFFVLSVSSLSERANYKRIGVRADPAMLNFLKQSCASGWGDVQGQAEDFWWLSCRKHFMSNVCDLQSEFKKLKINGTICISYQRQILWSYIFIVLA
jgi:hypothetical protein